MFDRILIANRGEIACRVIRTAKRLGISTVAVYSDADRNALHVQLADTALYIGPSPAVESYLRGATVLEAALQSGAQAIHPGYGFLSENTQFASACEAAGITFIGPSAAAIDAMGSKSQAKILMGQADVPLIPGYHDADQSDARLRLEAEAMGFPILLKATAGGGGKGMREVHSAAEFDEALAAARRESLASFADDRMLIEKLLQQPRHVEVQVFCDAHGNGVYLSERDCSIQRRHQKVIEEAPAPNLDEALRVRMGETAVAAAKAIDYRGAGTVEFLLDSEQQFFFMEMNTRLQVEHPVTEMVTGLDLVEWQLRVAAGERLPSLQDDLCLQGHAMEARIYAEDTAAGFLPSTGKINYLRTPKESESLRIDTGIEQGSEISPYYDPMIAKLIVHGATRDEARHRLSAALAEFHVAGPRSNIDFLSSIVALPAFADADVDTSFIVRHAQALRLDLPAVEPRDLAGAAIAIATLRQTKDPAATTDIYSPWRPLNGWRMNTQALQRIDLICEQQEQTLTLNSNAEGFELLTSQGALSVRGSLQGDRLEIEVDGQCVSGYFAAGDTEHTIFWGDGEFRFSEKAPELAQDTVAAGDASFAAPMHGTIVALLSELNTAVAAGDPIIVLEAMKMEQTLRAPSAGRVTAFNCAPGDLVDRGFTLLDFVADAEA